MVFVNMRGRQRRWNQGAIVTIIVLGFVHGCSLGPPDSVENICHLFRDRPQWQAAVVRTWTRWGVPPEVTISFVYQESSFRSHARPPREKLLWIIPWKRPSTAYGYAQAIDATWQRYAEAVGDSSADRADFAAATDFIGWYNHQSYTGLGIDKKDARASYLAYHEGHDGYRIRTYLAKPWLLRVAGEVAARADRYRSQLGECPMPSE